MNIIKKVFGAIDNGTMMMPDNKSVAHAELMIGDSKIMLSDEFPEMKSLSPTTIGGSPVSLYLYVEDVDKTFNLAVVEGGKSLFPVQIGSMVIDMEASRIHLDISGRYRHTLRI